MESYKTELSFVSIAAVLYFTTTCLVTTESALDEKFACGGPEEELNLTCRPGQVVTAFVYGGNRAATGTIQKKKKGCLAPDSKNDCQAPTINGRLRDSIQKCLWKEQNCSFAVTGQQLLGSPCLGQTASYLVAKQLRCVEKKNVIHLCSEVTKITADDSDIYLLSKDYPGISRTSLNCNIVVEPKIGFPLKFTSLFTDIHPRSRTQAAETACKFDYVQLKPQNGETTAFCGKEMVEFVAKTPTEVRFVTGPDEKHYAGFVIRVTAKGDKQANKVTKSESGAAKVSTIAPTANGKVAQEKLPKKSPVRKPKPRSNGSKQ